MDIVFYFSLLAVMVLIITSFIHRDYILLFVMVLVFCYEYVPFLLYLNISREQFLRIPLGWSYMQVASVPVLSAYSLRLLLFVSAIVFTHYTTRLFVRRKSNVVDFGGRIQPEHVIAITVLLTVFGMVSVATDAGGGFSQVYEGQAEIEDVRKAVHPFFWYARITFTFAMGAVAVLLYQRRAQLAAFLVVGSAPILLEFFQAGRRQAFAGAAVFFALSLLYSRDPRHRRVLFPAVVVLFVGFSSLQVLVRMDDQVEDRHWNQTEKASFPLISEFVATGAVSVRGNYWVSRQGTDGGLTILLGVFNALPFYDFSTGFSSAFHGMADWAWIAPRGGGSMFVEVLVSAGFVGLILFGVGTGIITCVGDRAFATAAQVDYRIGVGRLMGLVAVSVFVMSYRNGYDSVLNQGVQLALIGSTLALASKVARRSVKARSV